MKMYWGRNGFSCPNAKKEGKRVKTLPFFISGVI